MKILKIASLILVSLIGLVLVIAIFVPQEYHVQRTTVINGNISDVFNYVSSLENQNEYAVWQKKDPNVIVSFKGNSGEIGSIYSWNSKVEDVGTGEQEIINIENDERVDFELRFKEPMEMTGNAYFETKSITNLETEVTWGFEGTSPYPTNFFMLFIDMDKELGPDLEKGLANMKEVWENK